MGDMAHDSKTHAKARALYEQGISFSDIEEKLGVSLRSLKYWCKSEGWEKGKLAPKLHQKEQEAAEKEAERHGITKAKVLLKVAELIDAKSLAVITTQGAVSLCPTTQQEGNKGTFQGIDYDLVPDRKTQLEAAKLAADVLGMKKVQVDPSDEFRSFYAQLRGDA